MIFLIFRGHEKAGVDSSILPPAPSFIDLEDIDRLTYYTSIRSSVHHTNPLFGV
jgi:hypothetical protein